MVGYIVGFEAIANKLSDAWQAHFNAENPEFSNALFIKFPMNLSGVEYETPQAGLTALVDVINKSDNSISFEEGAVASTNGNVAYHIVGDEGEQYIRVGFRDSETKSDFVEQTSEDLDGVLAYSVGGPSLLGTPSYQF